MKYELRTGMGFDVHAFSDEEAEAIRLFGLDIPFDKAFKAHSDGDVALHALCDAIYGICANGDIGMHFPPSDPAHKGKDSIHFLGHALEMLKNCGGQLNHIDLTLIGEEPKIGVHRNNILDKLSKITDLAIHQIGLKATTTERLGFTGRGEGLACQAVATAQFVEGFRPLS